MFQVTISDIVASSIATIYPGDCGTNLTVPFNVTNNNYKNLVSKYHVVGNELRLFRTEEDVKPYIDKQVKLRSPMVCRHQDGVCRVCGGQTSTKDFLAKNDKMARYYQALKDYQIINSVEQPFDFGKFVLYCGPEATMLALQWLFENPERKATVTPYLQAICIGFLRQMLGRLDADYDKLVGQAISLLESTNSWSGQSHDQRWQAISNEVWDILNTPRFRDNAPLFETIVYCLDYAPLSAWLGFTPEIKQQLLKSVYDGLEINQTK